MARIIDSEYCNLIGDNVKKYRKAKKLSQQALSNQLELMGGTFAEALFRV